MSTILAALRSIVLGAAVFVGGVAVTRSSLLGFDVAGRVGLGEGEAVGAIEAAAVGLGWPLPSPRTSSSTRPVSLLAMVVDAAGRVLRGLGSTTIRNAPLLGGYERVKVSCSAGGNCSADEHRAIARAVACALRGEGLNATADWSTVVVLPS